MNKSPLLLAALIALGAQAAEPRTTHSAPVTLNFVNADIEAVSRAIGVMLNKQVVIDPRVKGQITVTSEKPLPVREAYLSYLAALRAQGFAVVENAGLLKIVPEAEARLQTNTVVEEQTPLRGDQIITQVFRIEHDNANNFVALLRPLITPNNMINANPSNNTLVITDYAENLQRIAKIIAAVDVPGATGIEVVQLKHSVASDLGPIVLKLSDAGAAVAGAPATTGSVSVLADPRGNALILRAASQAKLLALKAIVEKLDQPASSESNVHVVYLKNADAAKLATVLRAAFAPNASNNASSGNSNNSLITQSANTATTTNSVGGTTASVQSTAPVAASQQPSTGGFIQADPSTNSLIITAAEPLYRQIRSAIDRLDGRRAQIYVESMIVKVDVSKAGQFGVQWQNLFGDKNSTVATGVGTNFGTGSANIINGTVATVGGATAVGTTLASSPAPTGLNIAVLKKISGKFTLGALANALEGQTGANVLSTPNLVALDNEEAKIVIGQNVPFVTGSFTNTGATGSTVNPFQTVDRKDVGLTLRIRSQIGEGNTVRMTVYEENSSVVASTAGSTNGPTTDKSAVETTVSVDDGSILVLGGLMKDEYTDGVDAVPGLASIPLIGNLFKNQTRSRVKTNLMVFLRPIVLRDQENADQISLDRYDSIRALQQNTQPESSLVLPDTGAPVMPPAKKQQP
ncbi:MAG: type II secretion system secretin GspD [Paucibacter sp.]|nr:type II secretion system secretin GspD [Roseateles sp.]